MAASLFLRFYCRKVTTSRLTALYATEELLCVHELSKRNHIQYVLLHSRFITYSFINLK